jgi:hypothetical protein
MSLPLAFGTTVATIPARKAYMGADPQRVDMWRNRLGEGQGPRVGLAWSGNARHSRNRERSVALAQLLPLMRGAAQDPALRGVQFIGLQNDLPAEDRVSLALAPALQYFGEAILDFDDTAALIALCDLVLCVDTAPLHLAGALGKPAWLLASHMPDWRWLLERHDSPWYPSVRVIRQQERGNWSRDLQALAPELAVFLAGIDHRATGAAASSTALSDRPIDTNAT